MTENKKQTIQDIAIKLVEEQTKNSVISDSGGGGGGGGGGDGGGGGNDSGGSSGNLNSKESTLFILGSKSVGKTTIINRFLDRNESPKPTLALEYSFGRRSASGQGVQKEVCNIWELGSLFNSNQLIEIPIRSHGMKNFSAVIVLDLSQPSRLWIDLESALNGLKKAAVDYKIKSEKEMLNQKSKERVGTEHPDINTLELVPFPVLVVGGKYDLFKKFDPEIKKHVSRCLRSVSHAIGAALIYYASENQNLSKILRDTLNYLGFGSPSNPFRKTVNDYNEAIVIPFGGDSWEKIGVMPSNSERIGVTYSTQIPQVDKENRNDEEDAIKLTKNDPAKDSGFREAVIDGLRAQKDEELLRLIRDTEMRIKFDTMLIET